MLCCGSQKRLCESTQPSLPIPTNTCAGLFLPNAVFWPGEFHGLYSPWGRKELDTTERLSLSLFPRVMGNLTSEIKLQERLTSALLVLSLACCSDGSSLLCCELPRGEVHMTRIRGQPLANSQWGDGSPQSNSLGGTEGCQLLLE